MRLGRDVAPDEVKSLGSRLPWPRATVLPVASRSRLRAGPRKCPKPSPILARLARQIWAAFETGNVRIGSGHVARRSARDRRPLRQPRGPPIVLSGARTDPGQGWKSSVLRTGNDFTPTRR